MYCRSISHRPKLFVITIVCALLLSFPVYAYEIIIDIDLDDDPNTINEISEANSCVAKLILKPTVENELINFISFGLGGSCHMCSGIFEYGTTFLDLIDYSTGDWIELDDFSSSWDGVLGTHCSDPGYHNIFDAEPLVDGYFLNEAIFLVEFEVFTATPVPGCNMPPANLAVFHSIDPTQSWGVTNYIQLGGSAVANEQYTWSTIKAIYR